MSGRLPPAHRHTESYPVRKLLLTDARRASIVSCMANHSPHLDNVFRALADPTRRAIIARLSQSEASVGELAQPFDMALAVEHIMASCALPPAFPPVRIDGELYWDGGILSNYADRGHLRRQSAP